MQRALVPSLLLAALVLAGCAANSGSTSSSQFAQPGDIEATDTTGGIHGIVVDQTIRPIAKVFIEIGGPSKANTTTDDQGTFVVSHLVPGTYLVKASKPLYDSTTHVVEVKAGVKDPDDVKLQLNQVIFAKPYVETLPFHGYLACSQDFSGLLFSEECGQGVGVPATTCSVVPVPPCVPNPVMPGQRVGTQPGNAPQFDFTPSANYPQSIIVELQWQPTVGAVTTGALWTIVAKDLLCDPTCGGTEVMNYGGGHYPGDDFGNCATSPSYIRQDSYTSKLNLTAGDKLSTFTWACGKGSTVPPDPVFGIQPGYDLEFQQKYDEVVTMSYVLPLPEHWSFIAGSPSPF